MISPRRERSTGATIRLRAAVELFPAHIRYTPRVFPRTPGTREASAVLRRSRGRDILFWRGALRQPRHAHSRGGGGQRTAQTILKGVSGDTISRLVSFEDTLNGRFRGSFESCVVTLN